MTAPKTLHFWREDCGEEFSDAEEFNVFDMNDLEFCAEEYAEHYHDNRDGWECSWPIVFVVAKNDGTILGKVSVDREARPVFSGREVRS